MPQWHSIRFPVRACSRRCSRPCTPPRQSSNTLSATGRRSRIMPSSSKEISGVTCQCEALFTAESKDGRSQFFGSGGPPPRRSLPRPEAHRCSLLQSRHSIFHSYLVVFEAEGRAAKSMSLVAHRARNGERDERGHDGSVTMTSTLSRFLSSKP